MKEKDALIDKLRDAEADALRRLQIANGEKDQIFKDKDEMLLLTKARILKLEVRTYTFISDIAVG